VATGAAAAPIDLPSRSDKWIRVQTANFTLFSDTTESKTREIGLDLERLRAVLLRIRTSLTVNAPVPTSLYVFKRAAAFEPYWPRVDGKPYEVSALFYRSPDGNYIALTADWNDDPRPRIYHQYLHYFLHANFAPLPFWFVEGTAEYYGSFRATDTDARVGMPIEEHVKRLRQAKLMPFEQLFAIDENSPEYNEDLRRNVFYAESWSLVHYLLHGNPERTAQLGRFLNLLQQGKPREEAFREAFRTDYATLFAELYAYVHGSRFLFARYAYSDLAVPAQERVQPLSYPETLCRLGDLLAHESEDRFEDAEIFFRAALAADPGLAAAETGLGYTRWERKQYVEAAEHFQKAVASDGADFRAFYYDGRLRMEDLLKAWTWPATEAERAGMEAARASLRKSIALNPDFPEARAALGRTYLVEKPDQTDEGIAELALAAKGLPSRTDIARDLATLTARKKEHEIASRAAEAAPAAAAAAPATPGAREESRQRDPLDKVNALLARGKEDEAVAMLEGLVANSNGAMREVYDDELVKLKAGVARNKSARAYRAAAGLYNRREYTAALKAFDDLAATFPKTESGKAARARAAEIRALLKKP
jgi:tetratricopeptide (TPR) repeat protein